jgi:hypothetical protein
MEGIPDRFERVPFTRSAGERSRRSYGLPTRANPREMRGRAAIGSFHEDGRGGRRGRSATGVPEARSHTAPWEENAHAAAPKQTRKGAQYMCRATTRRSGIGRRETPVPPVLHCAEPKTPRGVHASQEVHGAGNARGAGARDSIGWPTSVRRIARLPCRAIARSVGRSRALAGRKSAAPPDAERGWVKGKTVRLVRGHPQDSTHQGMQVSACTLEHDGRRSRASAWRSFNGSSTQSPSTPRSTCAVDDPRGSPPAAQHIGRTRNPTRVCRGVTMRTSEVGTVR